MRVTMEYVLPKDDYEYRDALNGAKYHQALEDIYQMLRNKVKYDQLTEAEGIAYNDVYDRFNEILHDNDVDLFRE